MRANRHRASPDAHRTLRSPPGSSEPTRTPPGVRRQPAPLEPLEARLESLGAHRTTCGARRTSVLHGKLRPPIARDDATECPRTLTGASAPTNLLADSDALYPKSAHCVDRVVTKTTSFVGSFTELCTVTNRQWWSPQGGPRLRSIFRVSETSVSRHRRTQVWSLFPKDIIYLLQS